MTASAVPDEGLDAGRRAVLTAVADLLIPAAHGMPRAGAVVGDTRIRFVLGARPDLAAPLAAALRPELGDDAAARVARLERDEPEHFAALIATVVFGYYTDRGVRERLHYPGQEAKQLYSWKLPEYIEEGLLDAVLARGAVWRDPITGQRSVAAYPTDYPPGRRRHDRRDRHRSRLARPVPRLWRPGSGEPREVREPATGRPLLTLPQSTPDDVARAAAAAAAAQPAWAETNYAERAAILRRAAEIYEAHRPELGAWTQRETGAVHGKMHHEQNFAVHEIHNAATMPSQPYGSLVPSVQPGRLSMVRRVPVGVVGAITPWNSPSVLGMRVVAPALALGNAVVLKPDPQTPVCGGAMFAAVFSEAGLPDGLLQIVVGGAETGEALVTDPHVDAVSFTGSTAAGRRVGELAGRLLKKVSLELGGNNAFVVLDDADLEAAASAGAYASFQFQGQVCFAAGRHIVHRSIAPRYLELLAEKARRLRLGDPYREPVDLGPIVNERQLARVEGIVQRSLEGGARLVEGGTHEGLFYRPTVLADVNRTLPAWTDEIFGPVAPVVVFDTDEEALALANDSEYGLAGAVYSRSVARGLALAQRIRSGMVHVNDQTVNDEAVIPFGGMGASGNGSRFGGQANWDEFTQWQWVTVRDEPRSFAFPY